MSKHYNNILTVEIKTGQNKNNHRFLIMGKWLLNFILGCRNVKHSFDQGLWKSSNFIAYYRPQASGDLAGF